MARASAYNPFLSSSSCWSVREQSGPTSSRTLLIDSMQDSQASKSAKEPASEPLRFRFASASFYSPSLRSRPISGAKEFGCAAGASDLCHQACGDRVVISHAGSGQPCRITCSLWEYSLTSTNTPPSLGKTPRDSGQMDSCAFGRRRDDCVNRGVSSWMSTWVSTCQLDSAK